MIRPCRRLLLGCVVLLLAAGSAIGYAFMRRGAGPERVVPKAPAAAARITVGVPRRTLRFAAYNVNHNYGGMDRTVAELKKLDPAPDFVSLEEVEPQHVRPMSAALGMPNVYYPAVGHGPDGTLLWPDVAILSRHPLIDGRRLQGDDGRTFGLWATAIVDGKSFAVAGVHLWPTWGIDLRHVAFTAQMRNQQLRAMNQVWQAAGRPPLIVGGDFNQPAVGDNYALMTRDFTDTLKAIGADGGTFPLKLVELRIDYLLATPQWKPTAGGVIRGDASDHRPVWADVRPRSPGTTRPSSRPAPGPATRPAR